VTRGTSREGGASGRPPVEVGRVRVAAENVPALTVGWLRLDIASLDA
jgi:hypothetical protein